MKIENQIATVSLIISTLAFIMAISCELLIPEHVHCDYITYIPDGLNPNLELDNANQTTSA